MTWDIKEGFRFKTTENDTIYTVEEVSPNGSVSFFWIEKETKVYNNTRYWLYEFDRWLANGTWKELKEKEMCDVDPRAENMTYGEPYERKAGNTLKEDEKYGVDGPGSGARLIYGKEPAVEVVRQATKPVMRDNTVLILSQREAECLKYVLEGFIDMEPQVVVDNIADAGTLRDQGARDEAVESLYRLLDANAVNERLKGLLK